MSAQNTFKCATEIISSGAYQEWLSLYPLEAIGNTHSLVVQSRLASARNPHALQTRYQVSLTKEALQDLHRNLGEYLKRVNDK